MTGTRTDADVLQQRDYYARTADRYDDMQRDSNAVHGLALSAFIGVARAMSAASFLDVGAGTGQAMRRLGAEFPQARLTGVEPVQELREAGYRMGVAASDLVEGNALALPFADNSFDFVLETGVLHHIATPAKAVAEMLRVARMGILISDSNKYGQGSALVRRAKSIIRTVGLWNTMTRIATRGKMSKWSEDDGLFYSYSVFDNYHQIAAKFPQITMLNTVASHGPDLRRDAGQVALIAFKP